MPEGFEVEFGTEDAGIGTGLGEDFALGADDEAGAGIGEEGIAAAAVHPDDIGEILDGASAQQGGPVIDAGDGPVRDDDEELGPEGGRLAEGLGETFPAG